jgi:hypothetical protein
MAGIGRHFSVFNTVSNGNTAIPKHKQAFPIAILSAFHDQQQQL